MKLKLVKQSQTPVDAEKAKSFEEEFKSGFDAIIEEHGKASQETRDALDALDAKLQEKYRDAMNKSIEFPRSKKAWIELLNEYGSIMMVTVMEDGDSLGLKANELIGIINDLEF